MAKLKDILVNHHSQLAFWICAAVAIFLMIGGAITPPPFVIDGSILEAAGILAGFAVIGLVPSVIKEIKNGKSVNIKYGNAEVNVNSDKEEENQEA